MPIMPRAGQEPYAAYWLSGEFPPAPFCRPEPKYSVPPVLVHVFISSFSQYPLPALAVSERPRHHHLPSEETGVFCCSAVLLLTCGPSGWPSFGLDSVRQRQRFLRTRAPLREDVSAS